MNFHPLETFAQMTHWRQTALEVFPEFHSVIEEAGSPMELWIELGVRFQSAFREGQDDLVRRFFHYAGWCLDTATKQATGVSTAAWCAFYEEIPMVPGLTEQLHRFMPRDRFLQIQDAFRYHISESEFMRIREKFLSGT